MGPSHIDDISTADDWNFQSDTTHLLLFYFHPLIFFSCIHYTFFFSHPCPFLSFCSGLLPVISLSSIFFVRLFSPPTICLLLFSCYYHSSLTFMSHLIDLFLLGALSRLQRFLCFLFFVFVCFLSWSPSFYHWFFAMIHFCFCFLNLFQFLYWLSILFFFFVFPSATLLCLVSSRQGWWHGWAGAYLKCHWQSDKRSYGK